MGTVPDHVVYYNYRLNDKIEGVGMTTIIIELPDEHAQQLRERASVLGLSVEELLQRSINNFLLRPDDEFQDALAYVLQKNAELYRRLA
jgi:hypothetical protein